MKKNMSKLCAVMVLCLGSINSAYAGSGNGFNWCSIFPFSLLPWCSAPTPPTKPTAAPEVDPASAVSALVLLAGGLAVLRGRSLKKK